MNSSDFLVQNNEDDPHSPDVESEHDWGSNSQVHGSNDTSSVDTASSAST